VHPLLSCVCIYVYWAKPKFHPHFDFLLLQYEYLTPKSEPKIEIEDSNSTNPSDFLHPLQIDESSRFDSEPGHSQENAEYDEEVEQKYTPEAKRKRFAPGLLDLTKSWAVDISKMTPIQQIHAKKAISDVLYEGLLGNLSRNCVRISSPEEMDEQQNQQP